jgi:trimeric autotransporter adhesin
VRPLPRYLPTPTGGRRGNGALRLTIFFIAKPSGIFYNSHMKTTTSSRNSIHSSLRRCGLLLIPLLLAYFALSPAARAVCQEGCLGHQNTVLGNDALLNNAGGNNTAIGFQALFSNTDGFWNTAIGESALHFNTTGIYNTAIGVDALYLNTTGFSNTAIGAAALIRNTTGTHNTANGYLALYSNTTGIYNTAEGALALTSNTSGHDNTAVGFEALLDNTTGIDNTASGYQALVSNTTGKNNVAEGSSALRNNTTGDSNIAVGESAGANLTTGSNNIDIGNLGVAAESNTIRVGTVGTQTNAYIAGIRDTPLAHGAAVAVGITADGQLGVRASSARFKELVKPMDKASEAIFSLQPVTFRYKKDPAALPQFGLVAEEVAKVNPDLVARDVEGKPFTVRYDEINAMLLNEFLKEHQTVQELKSAAVKQEAMIARQQKQIDSLTVGLQKVSAQLEQSKSGSQTVAKNQY